LNSYHKGYIWTDEITRGIEETLKDPSVELHIEYMDTKRQFDPLYEDLLSSLLSFKHSKFHYDAIITSDNNAFNFFRDRGFSIFGDTPLVFSGFNYFHSEDLAGMKNVTGVNEKADLEANFELISSLHSEAEKILIIADNTITGKQIQEEIERIRDEGSFNKMELQILSDVSYSELVSHLTDLEDNVIVYFTVFFRDRYEQFLEYDHITELICRNSPVPVYGAWDFQLGHGIVGGRMVDSYQQGVDAAEKTLLLLKGVSADDIPIKLETTTTFQFDYNILVNFNIPVKVLPEGSEIINLPVSLYFLYKRLIWSILFAFLMLFLAFLVVVYGWVLSKRAELLVRNKEQNLRTTLYSIGDAVISTDLKGLIERMNPVAEKLTGWSREEAVGRPLSEVFQFESLRDNVFLLNPVDKVLSSGKMEEASSLRILISKEGTACQISDSAAPILNDDGKITGVVLVFRDISEEFRVKQQLKKHRDSLKQERDLFENLFQTLPLRMYIKDIHSRNIRINKCLADLLNLKDVNEAVGKNNFDYFSKEHARKALSDEQAILKSGISRVGYEEKETWPDGRETWCLSTKMPFRNHLGEIIGLIGISQDITERKKAEEALVKSNDQLTEYKDHLEELVLERTKELQESLNNLKKTQTKLVESEKMAALGSIVAGVAHEINTPVGIGVTAASYLQEETENFNRKFLSGNLTKHSFEKFLEMNIDSTRIILRNLSKAADLIQSFKLVAVDQSSMEMRDFEIREYTNEIVLSLNPQFRNTEFSLTVNCPQPVNIRSYPGSYSQVITNLIMNSFHHGFENRQKGVITIDIATKGEMVEVLYRDTGKGIPEEIRDKIFEPFFTTKRGQGGSGLGLHIVYNLVTQSLNGTIEYRQTDGEGAGFLITFPATHKEK
jgi:PAS domain S-box-containing protein